MGWSKDWSLINIPTYIPLLEEVGFGGQPGYYSCKWKHNGSGQGVVLLIRAADQTDEYPHLTVDFNPNTGAVTWFHYSPSKKSKQRYGAGEIVKTLLPVLQACMGSMPADVMTSLLKKP